MDGPDGQREVCGAWTVSVHPDLQGGWQARCANGDTGGLQVSVDYPGRDSVFSHTISSPFDGSGSRNVAVFTRARGTGCFHNDAEMFECEGEATLVYNLESFALSECAGERHRLTDIVVENASRLNGPDSFDIGECTFTRGVVDCCAPPETPTPCFECVEAACPDVYEAFWCIPEACDHEDCIYQCVPPFEACSDDCSAGFEACTAAPGTGVEACLASLEACEDGCHARADECEATCGTSYPDGKTADDAVDACAVASCSELCRNAGPSIRAECAARR